MFEAVEKAIQQRVKVQQSRPILPIRRTQTLLLSLQRHSILQMGIPAKQSRSAS
jgi:hypothetical protein